MKILFLNPKIDAGHQIFRALQERGVAVLLASQAEEAWQIAQLHSTSIDLGVIHREGSSVAGKGKESGLELVGKIKMDPGLSDLPIILTTDNWSDLDCVKHQESPQGVNAYLRSPFSEAQLFQMIEAVLGVQLSQEISSSPSVEPMLEDGSRVFLQAEKMAGGKSITLEAPELEPAPSVPREEVSMIALEAGISLAEPPPSRMPEPPQLLGGEGDDPEVHQEMPYLFKGGRQSERSSQAPSPLFFAEPLGNAIVPGGAANTPDVETVKKYLMLREQDVAVLSNQLKAAQDQIAQTNQFLREEKAKTAELSHLVQEQKHKVDSFDKEKEISHQSFQSETNELRFQAKAKADKVRILETQIRELSEEMENLKERVRMDIRKIRTREKELENRLEIVKKDSEALIAARETKIVELKRKLDLLEFNMDLLQEQYTREKETTLKLRERLLKAAQVVRVAGGLLDSNQGNRGLGPSSEAMDEASLTEEEKENKAS